MITSTGMKSVKNRNSSESHTLKNEWPTSKKRHIPTNTLNS